MGLDEVEDGVVLRRVVARLLEVLERTPSAPLVRRAAVDEVDDELTAARLPTLEIRGVELAHARIAVCRVEQGVDRRVVLDATVTSKVVAGLVRDQRDTARTRLRGLTRDPVECL